MTLLDSIREARGPAPAVPRRAGRARPARSATSWSRRSTRTGGHLGPEPRCGRAHARAAPGLRLARDRIVCSTPATRRTCTRSSPAGRPASTSCASAAGCPATRTRPSPSTTSSRTRTPPPRCPTPTAWPRRTRSAASDRHVVAVVGDGALTGGMCWEALNNIAAAKDRRWSSSSTTTAARTRRPSAGSPTTSPRCASTRATRRCSTWSRTRWPARRWSADPLYEVLHAVKKGIKDAVAPQAHVRGPRHQVRRPGRRARHGRRSRARCGGPRASAARYRARRDPQGLRLPAGRGRRGRTGCTGPARSTRRPASRSRRRRSSGPRSSPTSWSRSPTSGPTSSASPPRCASRPASPSSPRSTRTGPSTSASPSSTRPPRPPGWPSAACTRWSRSTRRSSTGPSTRSLLDVAMHRLPVTFVLDRAGITGADGPSHYGIWDLAVFGVVPGLRHRRAPRRGDAARASCARRSRSRTARRSSASRRARAGRPAGGPPRRRRRRAAPRPSARGRAAGRRRRVRRTWPSRRGRAARRAGLRRHRGRPALGPPGRPARWSPLAARHRSWSRSRTAAGPAAPAARSPARCEDAEVDVPLRTIGLPKQFLDHGKPADVRAAAGLNPAAIAERAMRALTRRPRRPRRRNPRWSNGAHENDRHLAGHARRRAAPGAGAAAQVPADQGRVGHGRRRRARLGPVDDHHADRGRELDAAADRRADRGRLRHRPGRGAVPGRRRGAAGDRPEVADPGDRRHPLPAQVRLRGHRRRLRGGPGQPGQHQGLRRPGRRDRPGRGRPPGSRCGSASTPGRWTSGCWPSTARPPRRRWSSPR